MQSVPTFEGFIYKVARAVLRIGVAHDDVETALVLVFVIVLVLVLPRRVRASASASAAFSLRLWDYFENWPV